MWLVLAMAMAMTSEKSQNASRQSSYIFCMNLASWIIKRVKVYMPSSELINHNDPGWANTEIAAIWIIIHENYMVLSKPYQLDFSYCLQPMVTSFTIGYELWSDASIIYITVIQSGTYQELQEQDGAFAEFLRNYAVSDDDVQQEGDPTGKWKKSCLS